MYRSKIFYVGIYEKNVAEKTVTQINLFSLFIERQIKALKCLVLRPGARKHQSIIKKVIISFIEVSNVKC